LQSEKFRTRRLLFTFLILTTVGIEIQDFQSKSNRGKQKSQAKIEFRGAAKIAP